MLERINVGAGERGLVIPTTQQTNLSAMLLLMLPATPIITQAMIKDTNGRAYSTQPLPWQTVPLGVPSFDGWRTGSNSPLGLAVAVVSERLALPFYKSPTSEQ